MTHAEFKPHAFITLSNVGGIEIMLNKSEDGVFYRFSYGQDDLENEEIFEAEIQFDQEGDAYFIHDNPANVSSNEKPIAYYLNQAMRTN